MRRVLAVVLAITGAACAGLFAWGGPLADLRPEGVRLAEDPASEQRAREELETMQVAMGVPAFLRRSTTTLTVHDEWHGVYAYAAPWPAATQTVQHTAAIDTFDSHATFVDGPAEGSTWGFQTGRTWRDDAGALTDDEDGNTRFILPTVQYFFHLPHRIAEAPIVRQVGTETLDGVVYNVVYATWGSVEANPQFDQYVLYIDADSHQLAKAHFTVRDAMRFVTGTAHYEDLTSYDGYQVPGRLVITTLPTDDLVADALHTFTVKDFVFDTTKVRRPLD